MRELTTVTFPTPIQLGGSIVEVASSEKEPPEGMRSGAVYRPDASTVPQSLAGQFAPESGPHVTVWGAASGVTGAENCCCKPTPTRAGPGVTVTVMGRTVISTVSDLVGLATEVAVISTLAGDGGVEEAV